MPHRAVGQVVAQRHALAGDLRTAMCCCPESCRLQWKNARSPRDHESPWRPAHFSPRGVLSLSMRCSCLRAMADSVEFQGLNAASGRSRSASRSSQARSAAMARFVHRREASRRDPPTTTNVSLVPPQWRDSTGLPVLETRRARPVGRQPIPGPSGRAPVGESPLIEAADPLAVISWPLQPSGVFDVALLLPCRRFRCDDLDLFEVGRHLLRGRLRTAATADVMVDTFTFFSSCVVGDGQRRCAGGDVNLPLGNTLPLHIDSASLGDALSSS